MSSFRVFLDKQKSDEKDETEEEKVEEQSMTSIYGLNKPELGYNIMGASPPFSSVLFGLVSLKFTLTLNFKPVFIIFAEILNAYGSMRAYDNDKELVDANRNNDSFFDSVL